MRKDKTKFVIVRGCRFKMSAKDADKIKRDERRLIRNEWNKNNLVD